MARAYSRALDASTGKAAAGHCTPWIALVALPAMASMWRAVERHTAMLKGSDMAPYRASYGLATLPGVLPVVMCTLWGNA